MAAALIYFRKEYEELRPGFSLLAVLVGLVAIAIWIGIDSFYPKFGGGVAFDPTAISSLGQRNIFLVFRIVGAVIVVPVMEELFWRAFLIRWLVKEDFKSVPVGTFTGLSFVVTVGMFGAEHYAMAGGADLRGAVQLALLQTQGCVRVCHRPCRKQRRTGGVGPGSRRLEILVS